MRDGTGLVAVARETFQRRAGDGDHERALRLALEQGREEGLVNRVQQDNRIVPHNFLVEVDKNLECAHPGCREPVPVRLVPGQVVYPKWCAFHRPPHRRKLSEVPEVSRRSWEESLVAGGVRPSDAPR